MAANINNLSVLEKTQRLAGLKQVHEANETRYVAKSPLADRAEIIALSNPAEGEQRQVLDDLVIFVYNSGNTDPELTPTCATTGGGWSRTVPLSQSETWQPDFDYVSGDIWTFMIDHDAADFDGNLIEADVLYAAQYVDGSGNFVAVTSTTPTLTDAELLTARIVHGHLPSTETFTQVETDAELLTDLVCP